MKKFFADRKGAFAMQFALLVVPLTVCTGLAIDGGRAFLARYELASALDAAALAVGSTLNENSDLNAVAHSFVNANFHTEHNGEIDLQLRVDDAEDDLVFLKGTVTIDTYFMPLIGQPTVTISAESQVRKGGANVEVALALDVTGSMEEASGGTTRIEALKSAANLLIDKVVNPVQTPYFSKVAIVPWSSAVHVGSKHVDADVEDLRGTLVGTTSISSATWRNSVTSTQTVTQAGWRKNPGGNSISAVTWRSGTQKSITSIAECPGGDVLITSASHGYVNGDTVYISGAGGSYTFLNGNKYKVVDSATNTFELQYIGTSNYVDAPTGATTNSGQVQRCFNEGCEVRVTTSNDNAFVAGDHVQISGVGSPYGFINNADNSSWTVSGAPTLRRFYLAGSNGPSVTSTTAADEGTASECYVSDCRYRVATSADHGFSTSDHVFLWGLSQSGTGTSANTALNSSIQINDPSGSEFFLSGTGRSYRDWTSGGSAAECALSSCNVQITSTDHGLAAQQHVRIRSATGMTGINNCNLDGSNPDRCASSSTTPLAWEVSSVSGNDFALKDTSPALANMSGAYGSSGTSQCANYGCNVLWLKNSSGTERLYKPTQCIVERYGDDAYTDEDPDESPLGVNYTNDGACDADTANYVTPLTSDKTRLKTAITDLKTGGSTGGQLGVGWGWYMLSENFDAVWAKETENKPKEYGAKELAKVMVLMTDGEFNYATCNGVTSSSISSTLCTPHNAGDPSTTKHAAFKQAEALCAAAKEKKIIIYTVGMQLDTSLYSDDFLSKCATSAEHAYLANTNAELEEAFKKIAKEISKLRIAQ